MESSSWTIASCHPQELLNWAGVGVARCGEADLLPGLSRSRLRITPSHYTGSLSLSNICFAYIGIYLNTTPACDLATACRDTKLLHTMLTKFWLGYPDVIVASWYLNSCSHPDSQHWIWKHSLLLILQLLSTDKSKAMCWMCRTLEAYVLHPALPQVSCLWYLVFPLGEDGATILTWGLASW